MVIKRGEIWWAEIPEPKGLEPEYKRPLVVIQSNEFNKSRINTIVAAVITTNIRLAQAPGNIMLTVKQSNLPKKSVINVSQVITIDKTFLNEKAGTLSNKIMDIVDDGLRLVLKL